MLKQNDFVIMIHEETPDEHADRKNERKPAVLHHRKQRVAFCDSVESVASKKVKLSADKDFEADDTGIQTAASKAKSQAKGDKTIQAYVVLPEWFPSPFGLPTPGTRIDIDEAFLQNVVIPHNEKLKQERK
jgi:hypothetical protein